MLEHEPPMHENVQHSLPVAQVVPAALHAVTGFSHFPVVALQFAVQHSVLFAHAVPSALQVVASGRFVSRMASMKASALPSVPVSLLGPSPVPLSEPAPLSASSTVASLPHPTATTFAHATMASRPSTAQGSFRILFLLDAEPVRDTDRAAWDHVHDRGHREAPEKAGFFATSLASIWSLRLPTSALASDHAERDGTYVGVA